MPGYRTTHVRDTAHGLCAALVKVGDRRARLRSLLARKTLAPGDRTGYALSLDANDASVSSTAPSGITRSICRALKRLCHRQPNPGAITGPTTRGPVPPNACGLAPTHSRTFATTRPASRHDGRRVPMVLTHVTSHRPSSRRTRCWALEGCRPQSSANTTSRGDSSTIALLSARAGAPPARTGSRP